MKAGKHDSMTTEKQEMQKKPMKTRSSPENPKMRNTNKNTTEKNTTQIKPKLNTKKRKKDFGCFCLKAL